MGGAQNSKPVTGNSLTSYFYSLICITAADKLRVAFTSISELNSMQNTTLQEDLKHISNSTWTPQTCKSWPNLYWSMDPKSEIKQIQASLGTNLVKNWLIAFFLGLRCSGRQYRCSLHSRTKYRIWQGRQTQLILFEMCYAERNPKLGWTSGKTSSGS